MSKLPGATLILFASQLVFGAVPPLVCPAGSPIGNVDLRVRPARGGSVSLPLRTLNRLEEGDTIVYRPLLRASEKRKGEVAIVLVPTAHAPDGDRLIVLSPQAAGSPAEWPVPSRSSVAVFVYGPAGLNRNKVRNFLAKDDDLVSQLADYAEKTAQTEALIQALSADAGSSENVNAAVRGFASQYGTAMQMDRTQPANQQMVLALKTLNPAVATYDPIASQDGQRISSTAGLATSVAALFFGSPVGLAAGGTAMLLEMRSVVFPNMIFRSSLAQTIPEDGLGLCGRRDAVPAHTKVAYLWATRIPNIGPPHVVIPKLVTLPASLKAPLPIEVASENDWKYLDRARKWTLESSEKGVKPVTIPVHPVGEPKALEFDLTKVAVPPGTYRLVADWDWDSFPVAGEVVVGKIGNFEKGRLEADSQDRLVSKAGRVPVTLDGGDFQFVTKVELVKPGDKFFTPQPVPFALPRGFREGEQPRMDIQINTADLDPGDYRLSLTQADGKTHPIPLAILPVPPTIDAASLLLFPGEGSRRIELHGERLNLIAEMKSPGAEISLEAPSANGQARNATVRLDRHANAGEAFDLNVFVENHSQPVVLPKAIRVGVPLPKIIESRLSLPPNTGIVMKPGELPSGYFLSAMLRVSGLGEFDRLALQCRGDHEPRLLLSVGVKELSGSLDQLGPGQLFVTFDDSRFPNGCQVLAGVAGNRPAIEGEGYPLGKIVRFPHFQTFDLVDAAAGPQEYSATLTGANLETIDRAGWDPEHGIPITDLPSPIPGEGQKQLLRITLPPAPASDAPLYVWLRGEETGRASQMHAAAIAPPPLRSKLGVASKADNRPAP